MNATFINANAPMRVRELVAVCLAVMLHSLAFLYLEFPLPLNVSSVKQPLLLSVKVESNSVTLSDTSKGSASATKQIPEVSKPPSPSDQAVKRKSAVLATPDVMSVLDDAKEKKKIEPFSQQSFKQWLSKETGRYSTKHSPALKRFKDSFDEPVIEKKADIRYQDSVPSPLGGGIYKVRKNGVTCEQVTFVPMTMDEQLKGTISIIDNCSKEEKIKIKIGKP